MIIIKVIGGLGNQMFQYALYKALSEEFNSEEIKLDILGFDNYGQHNGYELTRIFNVDADYATRKEVEEFGYFNINKYIMYLRKKLKFYKKSYFPEANHSLYSNHITNNLNTYLDGYWQSEKYFEDYKEIIKRDFQFVRKLDIKNQELLNEITSENSVSVHIRRGDYLKNFRNKKLYGGICDLDYYSKGIELMKSKVEDPKFYFFSDDIDWVKENIKVEAATFVNWNKRESSYVDMQLMSNCKYNIIANSTFSWWGAWLNNNSEKMVIAPEKWLNDSKDYSDVKPKEWIKI